MLNAELRYKTTPDQEYELKIPKGSLQKFNLVYNDIPLAEKPNFSYVSRPAPVVYKQRPYDYIKHRVRPGETVASIARKYKVSSQTIYNANRIRISKKKKLINQARFIRIPVNSSGNANMAARKKSGSIQTYKVKKGDSLSGIARRFNVPVSKLKKNNNIKNNSVQIGRTLNIPS